MSNSVETRAATIDEATEEALRELGGVSRDEVDVEVLSEGRRGLFGSARRAHVRVTLRSTPGKEAAPPAAEAVTGTAEPAAEAAEGPSEAAEEPSDTAEGPSDTAEGPSDALGDAESAETASEPEASEERERKLNEEADVAADFVEGILDILDMPGDIEIEINESQAFVNVIEVGSGLLIGRRGATLDALQELVRSATQRRVERRSHVRVDVEGYRHRQLDKMKDKCRDAIAQVRESGEPVRLEPMDAYERKVMHDMVASTGGVLSSSEGAEPRRRVVILPESVEVTAESST